MAATEEMPIESRLPFCPRCQYSLHGLPAAHRCPECGLEFDAESRMWVAHFCGFCWRPDWRLIVAVLGILVGLLVAVLFSFFKRNLMGAFIALMNLSRARTSCGNGTIGDFDRCLSWRCSRVVFGFATVPIVCSALNGQRFRALRINLWWGS